MFVMYKYNRIDTRRMRVCQLYNIIAWWEKKLVLTHMRFMVVNLTGIHDK